MYDRPLPNIPPAKKAAPRVGKREKRNKKAGEVARFSFMLPFCSDGFCENAFHARLLDGGDEHIHRELHLL